MIGLVLMFVAGTFTGAAIVLFLDGGRGAERIGAPVWARLYPGCDRCMSLRYRATHEQLELHQEAVHGRVLVGRASW